jgi:HEAT repeat protein
MTHTKTMVTRLILAVFIFISSTASFAQSLEGFKKDFQKALDKTFSETALNEMFRNHSTFLTPHSNVTQLYGNLKGQQIETYPLSDFKKEKLYTDNINKLLNSKNSNHRLLAYLVIASSGDTSFEPQLLKNLKKEKEGALIWAGMALLYLNTSHTTPLFDFVVENENFGDTYLIPHFTKLNKDSLQQTAYSRINSKKPKAKVLAAQILAKTPVNKKTEELLMKAVQEWDIRIKGYAIHSIKELQIGNLLETFKPLIDSSQTRRIALEALANSPTRADQQYLQDLINQQDTVPEDLLNCYYRSKNTEGLTYWLHLLSTKQPPKEYHFFVIDQPLIRDDRMLPEVHTALRTIKNAEVLGSLVRALEGRTDETSTDVLLDLLTHQNSTVRYWTATSLQGNHSTKLIVKLPELLSQPSIRELPLTGLAIENKLDTLQSLYEDIRLSEHDGYWQRSALEYLSHFPKDRHKEIFKETLQNEQDNLTRRNAALGLARLKDESSVDLIIAACRQESVASDFNAQTYLIALGMIKGDKAKSEIIKYKNSKEQMIRELTADILKEW